MKVQFSELTFVLKSPPIANLRHVTSKCKEQTREIKTDKQTDEEMNFECKEISINDEEFGCTVSLSDTREENNYDREQTVDEIMDSLGQYIMLQRTYAEDEFEENYYYFETNVFGKSRELDDFEITLTETEFTLTIDNDIFKIKISLNEQKWDELKEALKKITEHIGRLTIK
jgi:hypothetical protein